MQPNLSILLIFIHFFIFAFIFLSNFIRMYSFSTISNTSVSFESQGLLGFGMIFEREREREPRAKCKHKISKFLYSHNIVFAMEVVFFCNLAHSPLLLRRGGMLLNGSTVNRWAPLFCREVIIINKNHLTT